MNAERGRGPLWLQGAPGSGRGSGLIRKAVLTSANVRYRGGGRLGVGRRGGGLRGQGLESKERRARLKSRGSKTGSCIGRTSPAGAAALANAAQRADLPRACAGREGVSNAEARVWTGAVHGCGSSAWPTTCVGRRASCLSTRPSQGGVCPSGLAGPNGALEGSRSALVGAPQAAESANNTTPWPRTGPHTTPPQLRKGLQREKRQDLPAPPMLEPAGGLHKGLQRGRGIWWRGYEP